MAAGSDNSNGFSQMLPLRALSPHRQPESRPLVWLRDPAQPTRDLQYHGVAGDSEGSGSGGAREASVMLRISLAPEGVVVRSREDIERRLSLVGRANLRRWRALELLRLPSNFQEVLAAVPSEQAFGADIPLADSELPLRPLRIGDCSQYTNCRDCLAAGRRAETTVATDRDSSGGIDSSHLLGCGWCAGRRRQCVPDLRGMCRNEETHLRNASQCEQPGP
jgi:hypothetical protein